MTLTILPSPWFLPALLAWHGLALVAPWFTALHPGVSLLLSGMVVGSLLHCWRNHRNYAGFWFPLIHVGGELSLLEGVDKVRRAGLPRIPYAGAFLTVLRFEALQSGERFTYLIWPDSLSDEDDRRLRRYLRDQSPDDK